MRDDGEMTPPHPDDLDAIRANDAEVVRKALVQLRGGAPFLSSRDAHLLVTWLDEGVPVARILRGLETAADKRRAARSRVPLSLSHAKRYLGQPRAQRSVAPIVADDGHPMAAIAAHAHCEDPALHPAVRSLVAALTAIPSEDPDVLADLAADHVFAFFDRCWKDLGETGQARYQEAARADLGDAIVLLDEAVEAAIVEEHARGLLRAAFPHVSVTTVLTLLNR